MGRRGSFAAQKSIRSAIWSGPPALQKPAPQLKVEINCFLAAQAVWLVEGRRLLRVATQEAGSPAWHRELNHTFTRLRDDFYAHERAQMQLVQRAYGLDRRETD